MVNPDLRVISLGAGVQSTALLLMAYEAEFEDLPDLAIFADTGWEPPYVYEHLEKLEATVSDRIEVVRVTAGNLREDAIEGAMGVGGRFASLPLHARGDDGSVRMLRRQCTREYKLAPISRELRRRLGSGRPKAGAVEMWLGISTDEVGRVSTSRTQYIRNRYPLIERNLSREKCLAWIASRGYEEPRKSSCVGCPFHGNRDWREIRADPELWADAVEVDHALRQIPRLTDPTFLHSSGVPLEEADLRTPLEKVRASGQNPLFEDEDPYAFECDSGYCHT